MWRYDNVIDELIKYEPVSLIEMHKKYINQFVDKILGKVSQQKGDVSPRDKKKWYTEFKNRRKVWEQYFIQQKQKWDKHIQELIRFYSPLEWVSDDDSEAFNLATSRLNNVFVNSPNQTYDNMLTKIRISETSNIRRWAIPHDFDDSQLEEPTVPEWIINQKEYDQNEYENVRNCCKDCGRIIWDFFQNYLLFGQDDIENNFLSGESKLLRAAAHGDPTGTQKEVLMVIRNLWWF